MSSSSINNLSNQYLQSILTSAIQGTGLTANTTNNGLGSINSPFPSPQDNSGLSPFAQLLSTLQQLQQSDPTKYQQVTQQIATNLQTAAQTAQSDGNTAEANQLKQLSTDFSNASQNGQLPNVNDLAQAVGGHHHHHHGGGGHFASPDSDSSSSSTSSATDSTASTTSSGTVNQTLNQLLASFEANAGQSNALNPANIILNTLNNAGIPVSNGG
jgi:hypothetical protein